jgi:hypothetical protein
MQALGIINRSTLHGLRSRYPQAFVVVKEGSGRSSQTTYDKQALDKFIEWRNQYKKG